MDVQKYMNVIHIAIFGHGFVQLSPIFRMKLITKPTEIQSYIILLDLYIRYNNMLKSATIQYALCSFPRTQMK